MPALTLVLNGQILTLQSLTTQGGTNVTSYTDATLNTPIALPATLSTDTTVWVPQPSIYKITLQQADGTNLTPDPINIRDAAAGPTVITPLPTIPQLAADDAALSGTYVQLPALTAPSVPVVGQVWKSNSPKHLKWPAGPGGRFELPFNGIEMSGWTGPDGTVHIFYTNNGTVSVYHSQCAAGADPTVKGNWSAGTAVLGQGVGGQAASANRSGLYVEGSTLHLYYQRGGTIRVATASTATPTVWTDIGQVLGDQSGGGNMGNTMVIKAGSTYYLFFEALISPESGNIGATWMTGMATSSTATGTFTTQVPKYVSLIPPKRIPSNTFNSTYIRQNTVSGGWYGYDAVTGEVVVYFHSSPGWDGTTLVYRATIPLASIGTDAWAFTNAGYPVAWPATQAEQMQIGDPYLWRIGNTWYCVWTGGGNGSVGGATQAYIAPLYPRDLQWNGYQWQPADNGDVVSFPQIMFSPPSMLTPMGHESGASSNTLVWPAANRMLGARFTVMQPGYYRYLNWNCVTQGGNIDIGIVKLGGSGQLNFTKIVSTGPFACPAGSNNQVRTDLGAGLYLEPGDYAMVMWADNTTFVLTAMGNRQDLQASRRSYSLSSLGSGIPGTGTLVMTNVGLPFSLEIED